MCFDNTFNTIYTNINILANNQTRKISRKKRKYTSLIKYIFFNFHTIDAIITLGLHFKTGIDILSRLDYNYEIKTIVSYSDVMNQ